MTPVVKLTLVCVTVLIVCVNVIGTCAYTSRAHDGAGVICMNLCNISRR